MNWILHSLLKCGKLNSTTYTININNICVYLNVEREKKIAHKTSGKWFRPNMIGQHSTGHKLLKWNGGKNEHEKNREDKFLSSLSLSKTTTTKFSALLVCLYIVFIFIQCSQVEYYSVHCMLLYITIQLNFRLNGS